MFKKILSIFLCLVCVFTVCIVSEVKSQAIFVVDDAVMLGIAISVCASIALSVGLGIASGQGSVYADTAEYILYHLPTDLYNFVMDDANYQIINGKLTLVFTKTMWDRFKNWFANTDLSTIPLTNHLGSVSLSSLLQTSSGYNGYGRDPNYNSFFGASEYPYSPIDYTFSSPALSSDIYCSWNNGTLFIHFDDGTTIKYTGKYGDNSLDPNRQNIVGVSLPRQDGTICVATGCRVGGYIRATNDIGNPSTKSGVQYWASGSSARLSGLYGGEVTLPNGQTGTLTYNSREHSIKFNGQTICTGVTSESDYDKAVAKMGSLPVNVENPSFDLDENIGVDFDTIEKNIETKPVATAIPRNSSIENDEVLVLPIRSNLVNPENPTVPLTKSQVKEREKEGLPIGSTIPAVPNMSTETGKDQGITIIAGRDVIDDTPVYNPAYPSVINPGNETITVTANNDVFPTASTPAQTEAFPTEAESAIVKTGEIVSDIAKDIATPLTPDDIAKGGNRMKLPALLLQKFPFCIPYDLYNAFGVLLAEPEAPNFDWPIKLDSVGINTNIHIDFSKYEDGAKYIRWFLMALWTVALIMLTRKVIWK